MTLVDEQVPGVADVLAEHDDVHVFVGRTLTREMLQDMDVRALIIRSTTRVDAELLWGTNVEFVATATAGVDHVDLAELGRRAITFAHAPGSNAWAVAEYVMSSVLHHHRSGRILIIGHGNVGSRLARAAQHFGFDIGISDPPLGLDPEGGLEHWLRSADIVTLHVPLTHDGPHPTYHMIGASELAAMKTGATLINTSRGGVVDEYHVRADVASIFDVFEGEPNIAPRTAELAAWITPHIAGYSIDAKLEGGRMVANAWLAWKGLDQRVRSVLPEGLIPDALRPVHEEALWFRQRWSQAPFPATFDDARKNYQLRREVLRHVVHADQ